MAIRKIDINIGTVPTWGDTDFDANVHENFTSLKNIVPRINDTVEDIDTVANLLNDKIKEVASNAQEVSENLLITKAASNYQGIWQGKGYATGQSVKGSNGVIYQCDVTHTTAQNPTTTTGYWSVNIPLGVVGNIMSPLLDLPLQNSLSMKAGVGSTTFTRASTATYIDRYGVLKTASIDEPRFEKEGYLNEGSSTNLLTYSDNMLIGYSTSRATLTLSTTELSPDGITYASKLRETTDIGGSYLYKSTTFTAGTTYTHSVFAKSINGQNLKLNPFSVGTGFDKTYSAVFDLTNGTISGSDASNANIVPLSNGWYRCSITATCTTTATGNAQLVNVGTDYNSPDYGLYIFGAQLEALPFASSYIPTTTSTVTRSADVLQVTRENNFPNAENNAQGYSIVYKYDTFGTAAGTRILWSLYTSSNNYVHATLGTNTIANSISNYIGANSNITSITNLDSRKVVQTQNNNSLKQYINGLLADNDVNTTGKLSETGNSLTNLTIGSFYGHISNFKVYDFELTPVEVALL